MHDHVVDETTLLQRGEDGAARRAVAVHAGAGPDAPEAGAGALAVEGGDDLGQGRVGIRFADDGVGTAGLAAQLLELVRLLEVVGRP